MDESKPPSSTLEDKSNALLFHDLCQVFEKISKAQGSANKLKLIFNAQLKEKIEGQSLFPLLRLILPLNDTERGKYGLKQASIAKTYVTALHLDRHSDDAKRLLNWKDPTKQLGVEITKLITGDFGLILEDVLKSRVQSEPCKHTLGEINQLLDSLAFALNQDDKIQIIKSSILSSFNAMEQKWLMRIVFQDLKVGLRHENVLSAFYPTALKRYNECTNLRKVCEEEGQSASLSGVQLFMSFSPMLAKGFPNSVNGQIHTVENVLRNQHLVMDLKLDGERCLIHIGEDNSFVLYTRRGNDYTENYWPVAHDVIACVRKFTKSAVILDGEICALDGRSKEFLAFGKNLTVAKLEREYGADKQDRLGWHVDLPNWMCFIAFDIIYIEGEDSNMHLQRVMEECGVDKEVLNTLVAGEITQLPLIVRRKLLESILDRTPHRVEMVPHKIVTSTTPEGRRKELAEYFESVVMQGEEGLVVKSLTSSYLLGEKSRSAAVWCKMKPEYGDSLEDLDVLILGGYYGEGHRGDGISTFLCGVIDRNEENETVYHSLVKVGTGYTYSELLELREKLKPHFLTSNSSNAIPDYLAHWKPAKRDDKPDIFINPYNSIVLQIKCAELVPSNSFSAGWTCRFPRVSRIRYDKASKDVMLLKDIQALRDRPRARIMRNVDEDDDPQDGSPSRHRKRKPNAEQLVARKRETIVDTQFTVAKKKNMLVDGQIFKGKVYCVLENDFVTTDQRKYTRDEIIEYICKQGGHVVANSSFPSCQVIAGNKRTIQIKNLITQGVKDVIDFQYIVECLDVGYLIPIRAYDFLGLSAESRKALEDDYDMFGDSYIQDITPEILHKVLSSVDSAVLNKDNRFSAQLSKQYKALQSMTWREIACHELDYEEQLPLETSYNCLYQRGVVIYFDIYDDLGAMTVTPSSLFSPNPLPFTGLHAGLTRGEVNVARAFAARLFARGAILAACLHTKVSHVVLFCKNENDKAARRSILQERFRELRLLPESCIEKRLTDISWVEKCLVEQRIVDVEC